MRDRAGEDPTTRVAVERPTALRTAGSSFDAELAPVMWQRTRMIFWIGLAAGLVLAGLEEAFEFEAVSALLGSSHGWLHLFHPISFAIGLFIIHRGERRLDRIQTVAFATIALNLLVAIPSIAHFYPQHDSHLVVGLLLFVTAAFLPWEGAQIWLAAEALILSVLAQTVIPAIDPAVRAYWDSLPERAALFEHVWRPTGVALIGAASILVSRSLYHLRRTAHEAKRLGNYVIERSLGEGGMGKVYVARHAMICRPTAVKVMSGTDAENEANLGRFEREVQLSASLTHPNTITIFDFGRTQDGTFYYAMEYLEGMDLQDMVERHGPLPPERVVYLVAQICGSLGEAHARGIVHRDVKPSNIFVTQRGGLFDFVKVLDFGLARQVEGDPDAGLTRTGMIFGTPHYIAPESVTGDQRSDGRSDLYNLGGVVYWLLTGTELFGSGSSLDVILDHIRTIPDPPSAAAEQPIPEELDGIVLRCLEKDPAARFQTADELLAALADLRLETEWSADRAREWWIENVASTSASSDSGAG